MCPRASLASHQDRRSPERQRGTGIFINVSTYCLVTFNLAFNKRTVIVSSSDIVGRVYLQTNYRGTPIREAKRITSSMPKNTAAGKRNQRRAKCLKHNNQGTETKHIDTKELLVLEKIDPNSCESKPNSDEDKKNRKGLL